MWPNFILCIMLFRICRISLFSQNRQCISSMYMRPVVYLGEAIEVAKRVFMNGGMLAWACCDDRCPLFFYSCLTVQK